MIMVNWRVLPFKWIYEAVYSVTMDAVNGLCNMHSSLLFCRLLMGRTKSADNTASSVLVRELY